MIRHTVPSDNRDRLDDLSLLDHARGFPSIVIRESELLCRLAPTGPDFDSSSEIARNYSAAYSYMECTEYSVANLYGVSIYK